MPLIQITKMTRKSIILLVLVSTFFLLLSPLSAKAASNPNIADSDVQLFKSLLSTENISDVHFHVDTSSKKNTEKVVDLGNASKVRQALQRPNLSQQMKSLLLSIPTSAIIGFKEEAQPELQPSASTNCYYANTAHGYVHMENAYSWTVWSYDVKQPFLTDGHEVCGYYARVVTTQTALTWSKSGESYSQGTIPAEPWTESNTAYFNCEPILGIIVMSITANINFWMYSGSYWDVTVHY